MSKLESGLSAEQRIILAIDTSRDDEAARIADIANFSGASVVKFGLQLASATSWRNCSDIAYQHDVSWVADAKIDDIPNTTAETITNLAKLETPPIGITVHTNSGLDSLRAAREIADEFDITILGVTELTSIPEDETMDTYGLVRESLVRKRAVKAVAAGIGGLVCSPKEIEMIKTNDATRALFTMIPGTRSEGANTNDQMNVRTPRQAIIDGADSLVIGRQITTSDNPEKAFADLATEINLGLADRSLNA